MYCIKKKRDNNINHAEKEEWQVLTMNKASQINSL